MNTRSSAFIEYTTAAHKQHLEGILQLQRRNLPAILEEAERRAEGFVTVKHSLDDLKKMNEIERHVIALDNQRVVGYLLAMTRASRDDIPILVPMFNAIDSIVYHNRSLADTSYIVVGQACVDKAYRGTGVFQNLYEVYAEQFRPRYACIVTEIDAANIRSLRAHAKIGFETILEYLAPDGVKWHIVIKDLRNS